MLVVMDWSVVLEDVITSVLLGRRIPLPEYTLVAIPTETVAAVFKQELSLELPTVSSPSTPEFPSASVTATGIKDILAEAALGQRVLTKEI